MRWAATISTLFHGVVLVLVMVGVPHLADDELMSDRVIIVDMVDIADIRNLPNRMADPELEPVSEPPPKPIENQAQAEPRIEPEVTAESEPVYEPPEPATSAVAAPPPPVSREAPVAFTEPAPPPPVPTPERDEQAPPPQVAQPQPKPEPPPQTEVAAFEPEPIPEPETKPEPPAERPQEKPEPPEPADPFASVLKSVEEIERRRSAEVEETPEAPPEPRQAAFDPVEQVLAEANSRFDNDAPLSMSELDNIRYQIQKNWNIPAGARDAQNMVVALRIQLTRDGRVISATVVDAGRMQRDPFFRTMAESAMRAVNVTRQIRDLEPTKYHLWRDMQINFDPKDMFG